jgi:hypothetical protein
MQIDSDLFIKERKEKLAYLVERYIIENCIAKIRYSPASEVITTVTHDTSASPLNAQVTIRVLIVRKNRAPKEYGIRISKRIVGYLATVWPTANISVDSITKQQEEKLCQKQKSFRTLQMS